MVHNYFNFSKLLFYFCPNPGLRSVPAPGDPLYASTATMDALCTKSTAPWVVDAPVTWHAAGDVLRTVIGSLVGESSEF